MLSSLWPPAILGGAERYASALAEHLRERGWEVGALTLGVEGDDVVSSVRPWPYRLDEYETHSRAARAVFHTLDVHRPGVAATIRGALDAFGPDLVHSHSIAGLSTVALTAAGRHGFAQVHTLHDYWMLCRRSALVSRAGTACAPRCLSCRLVSEVQARLVARHPPEIVIAVSNAIAHEHEVIPWMRGRVRVVRNPVTRIERPHRTPRAEAVTFGYLGRLTREKGVMTLVDAFVLAELPSARLVIAGAGPMRADLEGRASPSVELAGWVDGDAKAALLDRIDCIVVPSEWPDPAPLVIDEARGHGIPVIGARAGGIPELVSPADAPLLFPAGDARALADSFRRFAAEPGRFADDGTGLTDWDEHVDQVIAAYDEAIASR
jgi:glycosyltransferase involved in cell wall biosynthesis